MSEPEEKRPEIKVTDRRGREREPDPTPEPVIAPRASTGPRPPIDFTAFVLSFATTALVQMGAAPDPESGQSTTDLEMAHETIDMLGMLREKTRGNLTDEESKFFDAVLYDLRVRFVEFSKPKS